MPCPIAPPVSVSTSWRGAPAVAAGSANPEVLDSSAMIARSGSSAPTTSAALRGQVAGGRRGSGDRRERRLRAGRDQVGELLQRADDILASGQRAYGPARRRARARSACPGRRRTTPASGLRRGSGARCRRAARWLLGEVGEALDGGRPAPRSSRAGNVSTRTRAPVALAIALAARSPARGSAAPPIRTAVGSPLRTTSAIEATVASTPPPALGAGGAPATWPPSPQDDVGGEDQRRDAARRTAAPR